VRVQPGWCGIIKGLWVVIKIYSEGVGRVVGHMWNSKLHETSVSRIVHKISLKVHIQENDTQF
jgi:hypothetical protein